MRFLRYAAGLALSMGLLVVPMRMAAQGDYNRQGPPPQGGEYYQSGPWDQPPGDYGRDVQRQGYHDGFEGARRDLENHRQPNVNNRDEFRHYRGPDRRDYKDAFARGYQTFFQHVGDRRDGGDRRDDRRDGDRDRDHRDGDRRDGDHRDEDHRDGDRRDDQPHSDR